MNIIKLISKNEHKVISNAIHADLVIFSTAISTQKIFTFELHFNYYDSYKV